MAGVLTLEDASILGEERERLFSVPFTQIVKIEYVATVKAKTALDAVRKVRSGIKEEIDEQDSEVIAEDINIDDVKDVLAEYQWL